MIASISGCLFIVVVLIAADWSLQWQIRLLLGISNRNMSVDFTYKSRPGWKYVFVFGALLPGAVAFGRIPHPPAWSVIGIMLCSLSYILISVASVVLE